jgi:hypothetical protein
LVVRRKQRDQDGHSEVSSRKLPLRELARKRREDAQHNENIAKFQGLKYDRLGGTEKEERAPSPFPRLSPEERKEALKASIDAASDRDVEGLEGLIKRSKLAAAFGMAQEDIPNETNLPSAAPALWDKRKTGREVSPADFIRKHYGAWIGKGLTRAHIGKLDQKLYAAYARQVSRSPEKAVEDLPSEERTKRSDPEEALERIRAQTRQSVARHRNAM